MDPLSALAVAQEVRTQVQSIKIRIANFLQGQNTFDSLSSKLDLLAKHMSEVDRLLISVPNAANFFQSLVGVRDFINNEDWTMPQSLSNPFTGSNSSAIGQGKLKFHQFTRAKTLNAAMTSLETKVDKASSKLLHLTGMLASALNKKEVCAKMDQQLAVIQENRDVILSKLDNIHMYRLATSTPVPGPTIRLDFQTKGQNGNPETLEGTLKHFVLCGPPCDMDAVFAGGMNPVYAVLGMPGVGKTVALQGLGHDEEILNRFCDGVHYMTFGRGATLQTAIREISKIMTITGASTQVQNVKSATSLREAVDYAVPWFEGKICLYLLDDLWPSESLSTGYLAELRQLLRGSPDSRMAISTRNLQIALDAGCPVNFEPRDALGLESFRIFIANAARHSPSQWSLNTIHENSSVSKILSICGGLPIALSVTGCAVAKYARRYGRFEKACDVYSKKLEDKKICLGDQSTEEGTSLNAAILLSLEFLQVEFGKGEFCDRSIIELYTSLCILESQVWISGSVLQRLWQLDEDETLDVLDLFCEMSLATRQLRLPTIDSIEKEPGIVLHDLQLDFCQRRAKETKCFTLWHSRLLSGYLEKMNQTVPEIPNPQMPQNVLSFTPRPWWSTAVPDDGYIHANLSRHMARSGHYVELAALLLDGQWTQLRRGIGGFLALETDFEQLEHAFERDLPTEDIKRSFEHIFKAVRLSWGRLVKGLRVFQFHVCGRLTVIRKANAVVEAYLKSIEKCTPKPYLLPVSSLFPDTGSSLIMELPVGGGCMCVACSPCGRFVACGAGCDIVIAKTSNGEVIQLMQGHSDGVTSLAFTGGSNEIVSGSNDGTVMLWEWDELGCTSRAFEGHKDRVTGVASSEGRRVFSSSQDRSLRTWDTTTAQTCELPQSSRVRCIAVRGEGEMVAFGLSDGTLKVVNSVTEAVLFEDAEAHKRGVSSVSFSPNGLYLATGSQDKTIRVWHTGTWSREGEALHGHERWVTCVSFSPDGKQIASSSYDCTIRVWDLESGKCIGISPKIAYLMASVSFTVDGQRIVTGSLDGIVRIWDASLGTESKEYILGHSRPVWGIAISECGLLVASASLDKTVQIWDACTGEQVGIPLEGHTGRVMCVAFSPDGRQLVSGSVDNTLRLWDTKTHAQIGDPFVGHTRYAQSVSFSFDGLRIVSGSVDGSVRIWNAETHGPIGEPLEEHYGNVHCVSETSDGCRIVSRAGDGTVIWLRESCSIVWKSEPRLTGFENKITDDEAESIIRSCARQTPHLWPESFPAYTAELYCEEDLVYSTLPGTKTLIADTQSERMQLPSWSYHTGKNVFAAGLRSGAVAPKHRKHGSVLCLLPGDMCIEASEQALRTGKAWMCGSF